MTTHTSPHQQVIAAALEDWWITTDPIAPFEPADVAGQVELYLLTAGYYIAPDTGIPPMHTPAARTTCDASRATPTGSVGPCILRHQHDGPLHKDAHGATWWVQRPPAPPSRASVAFCAFLVLASITGGVVALIRHDWVWAIAGALGALMLTRETADELAERRAHHRRGTL